MAACLARRVSRDLAKSYTLSLVRSAPEQQHSATASTNTPRTMLHTLRWMRVPTDALFAAGSPVELDQAALPRHLSLTTPLVGGTVLPTPMPGMVRRLCCEHPMQHLAILEDQPAPAGAAYITLQRMATQVDRDCWPVTVATRG